jgi:hypothetical protein
MQMVIVRRTGFRYDYKTENQAYFRTVGWTFYELIQKIIADKFHSFTIGASTSVNRSWWAVWTEDRRNIKVTN